MDSPILELRVALTAEDYEKLVTFYREGLGLDPAQLWTNQAPDGLQIALFEVQK